MIKNKSTLEMKIGEKIYQLLVDADSPIEDVHSALVQMRYFVQGLFPKPEAKPEEPKAPEVKDDSNG